MSDGFLTTAEAAERLGVSANYLYKLRLKGCGPVFVKMGTKKVLYDLADLNSWVAARRRTSTSQSAEMVAA